jgi:hypothetical protein
VDEGALEEALCEAFHLSLAAFAEMIKAHNQHSNRAPPLRGYLKANHAESLVYSIGGSRGSCMSALRGCILRALHTVLLENHEGANRSKM